MKKCLVACVLAFTLFSYGNLCAQTKISRATAKENNLNITGNDIEQTVTANGGNVTLVGNDCVITIKGSATRLTISGNENKVYVDNVNHIDLVGSDNVVNFKTSDNKNKKPITAVTGNDNVVKRAQ